MSRRLGDVVKKAFQKTRNHTDWESDHEEGLAEPDPHPYLPERRPRPITPTASQELPVQTCLLLAGLPAEIRRHILILAFGHRVIHMNLIHEYPVIGGLDSRRQSKQRGEVSNNGTGLRVDIDLPKRWTWGGCVCRRNHPPAAAIKPEEWTGHWLGPWADKCLETRVKHSLEPRSQWPKKYQIGVMGWLRSCRQAYLEGIDVLYRTNMIHIQGKVLISGIDRMLLPQRLAGISYLELNLKAGFNNDADKPELHGLESDTFSALSKILDSMLALKRIFLSIAPEMKLAGPWRPHIYMGILKSVDDFCRRQMSSEVDLEVPLTLALPGAAVSSVKNEAERLESELDAAKPFLIWRDFDGERVVTQLRYSTYPKAPLRLRKPNEPGRDIELSSGYWIMEGSQGGLATAAPHQAVFYPALDISAGSPLAETEAL